MITTDFTISAATAREALYQDIEKMRCWQSSDLKNRSEAVQTGKPQSGGSQNEVSVQANLQVMPELRDAEIAEIPSMSRGGFRRDSSRHSVA